jgi:hypothetical protein
MVWSDPSGLIAVNNTSYKGLNWWENFALSNAGEITEMILTGIVNLTSFFGSKSVYDHLSNWQNSNQANINSLNVSNLPNAYIAIEARKFIGSIDYAYLSWNGDFYPTTYKCNLFVNDVLNSTETSPGLPNSAGNLGQLLGRGPYPYSAEEWADPNKVIEGWRVLLPNEQPMVGDIASFDGHMGIVDIDGHHTISATALLGVISNDWGFRGNQTPVFRRYVGQ